MEEVKYIFLKNLQNIYKNATRPSSEEIEFSHDSIKHHVTATSVIHNVAGKG